MGFVNSMNAPLDLSSLTRVQRPTYLIILHVISWSLYYFPSVRLENNIESMLLTLWKLNECFQLKIIFLFLFFASSQFTTESCYQWEFIASGCSPCNPLRCQSEHHFTGCTQWTCERRTCAGFTISCGWLARASLRSIKRNNLTFFFFWFEL